MNRPNFRVRANWRLPERSGPIVVSPTLLSLTATREQPARYYFRAAGVVTDVAVRILGGGSGTVRAIVDGIAGGRTTTEWYLEGDTSEYLVDSFEVSKGCYLTLEVDNPEWVVVVGGLFVPVAGKRADNAGR